MNFGIKEIDDTVNSLLEIYVVEKGNKGLILSIPDDIIDAFKDFPYPTIHNLLESLLYYITFTDRLIEFDVYMYRFLEECDDITDIIIIDIISNIYNYKVVERLTEYILEFSITNSIKEKLFLGWLLPRNNLNFFTSFDFILIDGKYSI